VTSTIIMFGLISLKSYTLDPVVFSQTRGWMALYMGSVMAIVMIAFMWPMYEGIGAKTTIVVASTLLFAVSLWLVRSQETVRDVAWMKAMIPHHSIAILTSRRAEIRDPRVRELADAIIEAQVREIEEMKALIADLNDNPVAEDAPRLTAPGRGE